MTLWLIVELYLNLVVCRIEKYIESDSRYFKVFNPHQAAVFSIETVSIEPYRLLVGALKS